MDVQEHDQPSVEALSVCDLITKHADATDPWRLALVQRAEVWDESRMAKLLDSLLAGYPIGSLLVCRVRSESHVIEIHEGERRARVAADREWQLLDGQQRVHALVCLLSERGQFGHFLLDMGIERRAEELGTRKRNRKASTRYIQWRPDALTDATPLDSRWRFVDLSRWRAWAAAQSTGEMVNSARRDPVGTIRTLDPLCDPARFQPSEMQTCAERLLRLCDLWTRSSIPVQRLVLEGPEDVLQVFTRLNLEGVKVAGEDVFFAGVKTLWPDAEESLDALLRGDGSAGPRQSSQPLLDRVTALRLIARLATYLLRKEDLLPLDVARLSGVRGAEVVRCMRSILSPMGPAVARARECMATMIRHSRLGHGLRVVPHPLLEHVLAWACVNPLADDPEYLRAQVPAVDDYLSGATAFRYVSVFRLTFLRRAFLEAIAAASQESGFPVDRILTAVRAKWPDGHSGTRAVARLDTEDERIGFTNANGELFLSLLQGVPFVPPPRIRTDANGPLRSLEWDHIWPQAKVELMRERDPGTRRLRYHRHSSCVGWTGNLWALDQPLNNFARDRIPSAKFAWLSGLPNEKWPAVWPDERFMTEGERSQLLQAEDALTASPPRVDEGMAAFHAFAKGRTLRVFETVMEAFPSLQKFAPTGDPVGDEEPEVPDLTSLLGVEERSNVTEVSVPAGESSEDREVRRLEEVVRAAREQGAEEEMLSLAQFALELGLYPRAYKRSIMVTPLSNQTRMIFTARPAADGRGSIHLFVTDSLSEFFPGISDEQTREAFGGAKEVVLRRADLPAFMARVRGLLGGTASRSVRGPESPAIQES